MEHSLSNYKPKNNPELLKKVYKDFLNYHRSMFWGNAPTSEYPSSIWKANISLKDKFDILYTDGNLEDGSPDKDVRSLYSEVTPPTGTEHRPIPFNSFLMRMRDQLINKILKRNMSVSDDIVKLLLGRTGFQDEISQFVKYRNIELLYKELNDRCKWNNKTQKQKNLSDKMFCMIADTSVKHLVLASSDQKVLKFILDNECETYSKGLWCFINEYVNCLKGKCDDFDSKFRKYEYTHFTPVSKDSKSVTKKEFISLLHNKVIIQHLRDTMNTKKRKKIIKNLSELSPKFAKSFTSFNSNQRGSGNDAPRFSERCRNFKIEIGDSDKFRSVLEKICKDKYDIEKFKSRIKIPPMISKRIEFNDLHYNILWELYNTCKKSLSKSYLMTIILKLFTSSKKYSSIRWFYVTDEVDILAFGSLTPMKIPKENDLDIIEITKQWKNPYLLGTLCSRLRGSGSCIIEFIAQYVIEQNSNILLLDKPVEDQHQFYLNRGFKEDKIINDWYGFWSMNL